MRLLLVIGALLAASCAVASGANAPRVALGDLSPVTVTGSGFGHPAAVRVTVVGGDTRLVKTVQTTAAGTFSARWATTLRAGRCAPLAVSAVSGTKRAGWKRVTVCAPPVDRP
jgi:hypothetical protein